MIPPHQLNSKGMAHTVCWAIVDRAGRIMDRDFYTSRAEARSVAANCRQRRSTVMRVLVILTVKP